MKVYNKHHGDAPSDAVYIGRGSAFGNPFVIGKDGDRSDVIAQYKEWVIQIPELIKHIRSSLRGKDLLCYCAPKACHGDCLLKLANPGMAYAGIGSRETPTSVCRLMKHIAKDMELRGYTLRTGAQPLGADGAFMKGTEKQELHIPWPNFEGHTGVIPNELAFKIAARYHPKWGTLSQGSRALMARNTTILLGANLDQPVDGVICWTEGGKIKGGTGQGLRIAADYGIPVLNLAVKRYKFVEIEEPR